MIIWAIMKICKFFTHEITLWRQALWALWWWRPANTLPNYETRVGCAVVVPAVAVLVAEGFNYCQETKLSGGEPER